MKREWPIRADGAGDGRLYAGTSGFAYAGWSPRFYPAGLRADGFLGHYAERLAAVELNNTYYQQPRPEKVDAWLAATPATFRFTVKAQRGGSFRAMRGDPAASIPWLTEPYRRFGDRLGAVLLRVPDGSRRDDARLAAALAAWPRDLPVAFEFQDPSWHVDETFTALADAGAALCATEGPDDDAPPVIRRTGPFLYLRLRRHDYSTEGLAAWAARLEPFLAAGDDAFVFFRHDEVGRGPELASALADAVAASATRLDRSAAGTLGRTEHDQQLQPLRHGRSPIHRRRGRSRPAVRRPRGRGRPPSRTTAATRRCPRSP